MRKQESKKAKKQKLSIEKWKKSFWKRQGVPGWLDPQFFFYFYSLVTLFSSSGL